MHKFFRKDVLDAVRVAVIGFFFCSFYTNIIHHILRNNYSRIFRSIFSSIMMGTGILINFSADFFQNTTKIPQLFCPTHEFLENSKIGDEILKSLNERLVLNMTVLRAIQQKRLPRRHEDVGVDGTPRSTPSLNKAKRYVCS